MSNIEHSAAEYNPTHQHEPELQPVIAPDGHCRVCRLIVERDDARQQLQGAVELADMMIGALEAIWTGAMDGKVPDPAALRERIDWYSARLAGRGGR